MKKFFGLIVILGFAAGTVSAQQAPATLPDWSGVWQMVGPTIFDGATVEPKNGRAGDAGVREHPPYNAEWEAIYQKNIEGVKKGFFPDPITNCGIPHGFPRVMNVPDVYEFAITPQHERRFSRWSIHRREACGRNNDRELGMNFAVGRS